MTSPLATALEKAKPFTSAVSRFTDKPKLEAILGAAVFLGHSNSVDLDSVKESAIRLAKSHAKLNVFSAANVADTFDGITRTFKADPMMGKASCVQYVQKAAKYGKTELRGMITLGISIVQAADGAIDQKTVDYLASEAEIEKILVPEPTDLDKKMREENTKARAAEKEAEEAKKAEEAAKQAEKEAKKKEKAAKKADPEEEAKDSSEAGASTEEGKSEDPEKTEEAKA